MPTFNDFTYKKCVGKISVEKLIFCYFNHEILSQTKILRTLCLCGKVTYYTYSQSHPYKYLFQQCKQLKLPSKFREISTINLSRIMATERTRLVGITEPPRKYYLEISALVILGVCIVALCLIKSRTNVEYKIVETSDGKVRGFRDTTLLKKVDFFAFKGIPYAKVPTGELRFKVSFVYVV